MAGGTEAGATDKDGCQRSKRSALSLTVGYLECAIIPEISEKLVYTTCAWLGRCLNAGCMSERIKQAMELVYHS